LLSAIATCSHAQQIAFTIDDLPAHGPLPAGTTGAEIAAIADAGLPPTYGFVNCIRVEENPADAALLDLWRKSGNLPGNHPWSHMNLNQDTSQEFEQDIARDEPLLSERRANANWRWLRYPFLAEGTPRKAVRGSQVPRHASVPHRLGDDELW